jgi:hypothetical protein
MGLNRKRALIAFAATSVMALFSALLALGDFFTAISLGYMDYFLIIHIFFVIPTFLVSLLSGVLALNGFKSKKPWALQKVSFRFFMFAAPLKALVFVIVLGILGGVWSIDWSRVITVTSGNQLVDWLTTASFCLATLFALLPTEQEVKLEGTKEEQKAARREAKVQKALLSLKQDQEKTAQFGEELASGQIGFTNITIFAKGFVQLGNYGVPERLIGISSNVNSKKKNVAGRGLGTVVSGGANLLFTSANKGTSFLTVVTESGTQTFKSTSPSNSEWSAIISLEAAGQAAIEMNQTTSTSRQNTPKNENTEASIEKQLGKLAKMHKSGELTAEEYTNAKKKLLS